MITNTHEPKRRDPDHSTHGDNNNYTPLPSIAELHSERVTMQHKMVRNSAATLHYRARGSLRCHCIPTTIQCHKHLILINNQQLSPTSITTRLHYRLLYDQVEK